MQCKKTSTISPWRAMTSKFHRAFDSVRFSYTSTRTIILEHQRMLWSTSRQILFQQRQVSSNKKHIPSDQQWRQCFSKAQGSQSEHIVFIFKWKIQTIWNPWRILGRWRADSKVLRPQFIETVHQKQTNTIRFQELGYCWEIRLLLSHQALLWKRRRPSL